jgi:CPA1 family monovalent cation:H+ antiporter
MEPREQSRGPYPEAGLNFFSLVSFLISLAAVSIYVNYRYIKLPTTVGVMLV